jgi:hypothetical protein
VGPGSASRLIATRRGIVALYGLDPVGDPPTSSSQALLVREQGPALKLGLEKWNGYALDEVAGDESGIWYLSSEPALLYSNVSGATSLVAQLHGSAGFGWYLGAAFGGVAVSGGLDDKLSLFHKDGSRRSIVLPPTVAGLANVCTIGKRLYGIDPNSSRLYQVNLDRRKIDVACALAGFACAPIKVATIGATERELIIRKTVDPTRLFVFDFGRQSAWSRTFNATEISTFWAVGNAGIWIQNSDRNLRFCLLPGRRPDLWHRETLLTWSQAN